MQGQKIINRVKKDYYRSNFVIPDIATIPQ